MFATNSPEKEIETKKPPVRTYPHKGLLHSDNQKIPVLGRVVNVYESKTK